MAPKDPRIDAYIVRSADFAQPILKHLRRLVHQACPGVEETMKWSFPHFEYQGVLCSMASFKQHCAFGFWKQKLMKDPYKLFTSPEGMGSLGKITCLADLPADTILLQYLKEAVRLNKEGIKVSKKLSAAVKKSLKMPEDLGKALAKNAKARKIFEAFNYTHKKEYIEWLTDAKTLETRQKRLVTTLEWLAQGKVKNWKYIKK